ncbi:MAG: hypothetical protein GX852_03235 [Clostridiales bacterium]|jgi:alanyl-tRNA synthetase|nr:hypothetical protein [Clostridiales bacterium]
MATERLYLYREDYVTANSSKVTNVYQKDGKDAIVTESSCFFPEGGGQPSDVGVVYRCKDNGEVIDCFDITYVYDNGTESDVFHLTSAPEGTFKAGEIVFLEIDDEKRMINTIRHTGEHMLSGALHRLVGGVNKGFHMGDDYITIDIDLGGKLLTDKELHEAELDVNEAIRNNLPVNVSFFENYEASRVMPVRKNVPHDGMVSVVTVGDYSPDEDSNYMYAGSDHDYIDYEDDLVDGKLQPFDCIACCGTHVHNTGEIGLISIYKAEVNKGMTRIYFDCGSKALDKLSRDTKILSSVASRFSCKPEDLVHKLDVQDERQSVLKERVNELSAYAMQNEKNKLAEEIAEDSLANGSVIVCEYSIFDAQELVKFGFELLEIVGSESLLIIIDIKSSTVMLYSAASTYKCGEIIKKFLPAFDGRGGGRDDNARAVFADIDKARMFAEAVASSECE